jgi:hypothetical protein
MPLTAIRIEKLAARKGVESRAVENFLGSLSSDVPQSGAMRNLYQDAKSYGWSAQTVAAIGKGIEEFYAPPKKKAGVDETPLILHWLGGPEARRIVAGNDPRDATRDLVTGLRRRIAHLRGT